MTKETVQNRRYRNRPRALQVKTEKGPSPMVTRIGMLLLLVLGSFISQIWLTSKIENLERDLNRTKDTFSENAREIENLRVELEGNRTFKYISDQIAKRQLGLRPAEAGQRRIVQRKPLPRLEQGEDEPLLPMDGRASLGI